jgi:hypothetical protein
LGESIEDIARIGELRRIRNVAPSVEEYVLSLLTNKDEPSDNDVTEINGAG